MMNQSAKYKLVFKLMGGPDEYKIYRETKQIVIDIDIDTLDNTENSIRDICYETCEILKEYLTDNLRSDLHAQINPEIEPGDFDELDAGPDQ